MVRFAAQGVTGAATIGLVADGLREMHSENARHGVMLESNMRIARRGEYRTCTNNIETAQQCAQNATVPRCT
jgi:hypothetical protein